MTTEHRCIWPGCTKVLEGKVACAHHWFTMPPALRYRLWKAFVPGEAPSLELATAAQDLADWIEAFPEQASRTNRTPQATFRRYVNTLRDRAEFLSSIEQANAGKSDREYSARNRHRAELHALQWALEVLDQPAPEVTQ